MSMVLAALAGAAAWLSLGRVAVLDHDTSRRVMTWPPIWWLAIVMIAAVAIVRWRRPSLSRLWPLALSAVIFLPYIPGPIPAAFLMWDGPLEGFVWAAVFAGLLWCAPSPVSVKSVESVAAPWIAALLAAAAYSCGAWMLADLLPGGDEPHYLVITQSLLLDGDLRIENNHDRGDYRVYKDQPLKPDFIQRGIDGEIYPMHSPGVSALVLPAFAAIGYPGAIATVIVVTAAASALTWQAAWLLAGSVAAAWFAWAAVFLTTPFFFHGFTIYPDGVGALFTAAGVWLLVMMEKNRALANWQVALGGVALSVLPWLHPRFALIAGALGGAVLLRLLMPGPRFPAPGPRQAAAFMAGPVFVAVAWFAYFWIIWGTPNPSAPQGRDLMMSPAQIWRGGAGLLFDQQFGLIAHAPTYAFAIAGLALMARRHARLTAAIAVATLPYVISTASFAAWWGGVSAPARYFAALLPMAALPLAWWWRERESIGWRAFTLVALLLGVAMLVPKLLVDGGLLIYNDRAGFDLLLDWAAQSVDLPMAFPSLHRGSVIGALTDTALWLAAAVVVAALAVAAAKRGAGRGAVWAVTTGAAVIIITATASVVWARHGAIGTRPATSQLALLRAKPPAETARALEVRNVRRTFDPADTVRLRASMLPAGEYEVVTERGAAGELRVEVGRTDQALAGTPAGQPLVLRLPVRVHSVTVRGDPAVGDIRLRVKSLLPPAIETGFAVRAARYNHTRAFFMDDASYVEPGGFWIRGEDSTTIAFAPDRGGDWTLLLQAGPVPTSVTVSMGEWSERLDFAPHQQRPITLPPTPTGVRVLKIQTGAWFRPSDRDAQSQDTRRLAVFGIVP